MVGISLNVVAQIRHILSPPIYCLYSLPLNLSPFSDTVPQQPPQPRCALSPIYALLVYHVEFFTVAGGPVNDEEPIGKVSHHTETVVGGGGSELGYVATGGFVRCWVVVEGGETR